jgi:hypothetical protein
MQKLGAGLFTIQKGGVEKDKRINGVLEVL